MLLLLLELMTEESWFKNRALSIDRTWPDQPLSTIGKCFHADHPGVVKLLRIRDVQLQCHCMQIPRIFRNNFKSICFYFLIQRIVQFPITFLHDRTIFFRSYSADKPCTVVNVLRPLRCWILMCTRPSWTSSSAPLIASAKGSTKKD